MDVNLAQILYLAFRLSPFIVVCYFVLQSILTTSLGGIIYLAGLLITCAFITSISGFISSGPAKDINGNVIEIDAKCNLISLGMNGSPISSLPLSMSVFSFTFWYLFIFIINSSTTNILGVLGPANAITSSKLNSAMAKNVPTLIIFPLLIICDGAWYMLNGCTSPQNIGLSFLIGGICGILWALAITSTKNLDLQFIGGSSQTCAQPTRQIFRCKPTKKP